MKFIKILAIIITVLYPVLIYLGLLKFGIKPLAILLIVVTCFKLVTSKRDLLQPICLIGLLCGVMGLVTQNEHWLKYYPVFMSLASLCVFGFTLWKPPTIIERFARILHPNLDERGVTWTKMVTQCWCVFFVVNASIAYYTAEFCTLEIWTLYNGFISYILMGCLFGGEWILRRKIIGKL